LFLLFYLFSFSYRQFVTNRFVIEEGLLLGVCSLAVVMPEYLTDYVEITQSSLNEGKLACNL